MKLHGFYANSSSIYTSLERILIGDIVIDASFFEFPLLGM